MTEPREFEITLNSQIKNGVAKVWEEVFLLNRSNELLRFPAKFHVIEYSAYESLRAQVKVAEEAMKRTKEISLQIINKYDLSTITETSRDFTMTNHLFNEHMQNYKRSDKALAKIKSMGKDSDE